MVQGLPSTHEDVGKKSRLSKEAGAASAEAEKAESPLPEKRWQVTACSVCAMRAVALNRLRTACRSVSQLLYI